MMATSSANGAQEQGIGTGWQAVPSGWRAVAQQVASGIRAILQQRELHQQGRRWQKGRRHEQHADFINCINAPADSCPPNSCPSLWMSTSALSCARLQHNGYRAACFHSLVKSGPQGWRQAFRLD